jgi:hypothetical protein
VNIPAHDRASATDTQVDDLQSEMEAGARKIDQIAGGASHIRTSLFTHQLQQAELLGTLVRRINELRTSIAQQFDTLERLREEIRAERDARRKP